MNEVKWSNSDGSELTDEQISQNISEIKRRQIPNHANIGNIVVNAKMKKEEMN